ncbi:recombinase zinc beta ribbon domain-containing protein [Actinosynnema sp. NPDC023658]|uniref:recombinase zinc beta ribbon domain-containing protein n=1 Tax=Actinosynnema sp. NPDC023658 TaxID=3155465 RepID=UPI0033F9BA5B
MGTPALVRAILDNPRYTGFAFFGRWARQETLLDPDDVAAGRVIRFRRAAPEKVVRSRQPAHPAIVSVEEFVEAQLLRRSRAAGGLAASRKLERGPKATKRPYPLRGRVRCEYCSRRMEGTPRKTRTYYRCSARTLVPGSPALNGHPNNVYLPEAAVLGPLSKWLDGLFAPACSAAGPEPAPVGRWLAGQHGAGDPGQPEVHGVCVLRAVGAAGDVARP